MKEKLIGAALLAVLLTLPAGNALAQTEEECAAATSCGACTAMGACGWCGGRCIQGSASGGGGCTTAEGNWAWIASQCPASNPPSPPPSPPPPPPEGDACSGAGNCSACAAIAGCGWCNGRCVSGTAQGGGSCSAAAGNWAWTANQCPPAPGQARGPSTQAPSTSPTTPGATGRVDASALLSAHNTRRAAHCAPPLAWSSELAAVAQRHADALRGSGCGLQHSSTSYGENLYAGSPGASADAVVGAWYGEVSAYNFGRPGFRSGTGHFTQVVWRASTRLGCGVGRCQGTEVWVCNYDPAGNYQGQFPQNVSPTGCQ